MVHFVGVVFTDVVIEKGVRGVSDYITDFPTFIAPYEIAQAGISLPELFAGPFQNDQSKELLAIWKIWSDASNWDQVPPAANVGKQGAWRVQIKQLFGTPKFYSIRADFPDTPFDFFYKNFHPLQQQKTRRRVTKLKHHRYGYVLEKKEKKTV